MSVLLKPIVTEKVAALNESGKFGFIVKRDANKVEIKKAVEKAYGVNVLDVNTMNYFGKPKSRYTKSRVISDWPGLAKNEQYEQRDLMSTIDYRSVCAACIEKSLGLDHDLIASKVFFEPKLPRVFDYLFS